MRKAAFVALLFLSGDALADAGRRGVLDGLFRPQGFAAETTAGDNSALSLGMLLGLSTPLYGPSSHVVRDGVVVETRKSTWDDYLLPGVYALPSLSLVGERGKSLALIVPAGVGADKKVSLGFGLSYGFAVKKSVELGLSLALIWTPAESLSAAQEASLATGVPLAVGESTDIGSRLRPSLGLGIYITPLF